MKISEPTDQLHHNSAPYGNKTILDFWRWAYAILANDPTKGEFAEWMVGTLLGYPMKPGGRIEGADWDLRSPEGVKIEVKAAAYWQAWKLRDRESGAWRTTTAEDFQRLTKIKFAGLHRQPAVGPHSAAGFKSDLYIFCLEHEKDPEEWDALDLTQWTFFIMIRDQLETLKDQRDKKYLAKPIPKSFDLSLEVIKSHTSALSVAQLPAAAHSAVRVAVLDSKRKSASTNGDRDRA